MEARFPESSRRAMLAFVRRVIADRFSGGRSAEQPALPELKEPGSCFVTLKLDGDLRGCIGSIEAVEPLGESLRHNAISAAFGDPRFPPLGAEEFDRVSIEISVLTPLRPIASLEEFVVGRDGILFQLGNRGAVFLPQVAPEQGWDRDTTLTFLSRKAGCVPDAWRAPGARFFTFQAEVFGEPELPEA